ncbi:MAG: carboxypeptidase-like regulatory domain-containing protein, partial [Nanoarchaeota archaeon]|nr:carboxypeptidase-like regulatory domain-containing protein [Nanoarchaeota archaeon]
MRKTAYLLSIFIIALLIVSSAGAASFQIIRSTSTKQLAQTAANTADTATNAAASAAAAASAQPVQEAAQQSNVQAASPSFTKLKEQPIANANQFEKADADKDSQTPQNSQPGASQASLPLRFGVNRQALTIYDGWFWGLNPASRELHIDSKEVSGDTTPGETFTITITAADSDDLVTRISLGRAPYHAADFNIRDCDPAANTCTIEFEMSEAAAGTYTYMIKAKNERNQIVNDAITVNVVEHTTTSSFNFRTAAMDGEDYGRGIIDYVNSEIFVWGDYVEGLTLTGTPFATFTVPSNQLLAARYTSEGYQTDIDYFYFDSRLPSCSGERCTFTQTAGHSTYTTSCNIVLSDYHYLCTLTGDEGYTISFDYRATTDPIGPNTIRRYNLLYPQSAPIVDFGAFDASFMEGESLIIDLDDYVYDNDTSLSDITWTVRRNSNIQVNIDPSTHDAQFTQAGPSWIGNELIEFVATDPEGNTGSDILTVRVTAGDDNDPPVILSKDPDSPTANVGEGSSRLFSIDAMDPDYDRLTITWRKGDTVAATDTFSYLYRDTDGIAYPLTVIVSDGTEEASAAWDISIVAPIGNVGGVVTDAETSLPILGVLVRLYDAGSDILVNSATTDEWGQYIINDQHEGTYDIRFTK